MKFILAEKKEMTQHFAEDGTVIPVTRVVAGPCVITQTKAASKNGSIGIQIAFGHKKTISKPLQGHLKDLGKFQYFKEFQVSGDAAKDLSVGKKITANVFQVGDIIKVSGTSKGKGFQGVVKRHKFSGAPASHGHKDQLRKSGSIGGGLRTRVPKGMRMAGRMGGSQVTVTNLEVVKVNPEANEIFIKGAVPGPRNNLLVLHGAGELVLEVITPKTEVATPAPAEVTSNSEQPVVEQKSDVKTEEIKVETK